jgi:hypothetical protein
MSIEILIARMETHPEEFFDKDMLLDCEPMNVAVANSKWGPVVLRILATDVTTETISGLAPLYTADEKKRAEKALYKILREAIDAEIVRATMTGTRFGIESYNRQMASKLGSSHKLLQQATAEGQKREQLRIMKEEYDRLRSTGIHDSTYGTAAHITGTSHYDVENDQYHIAVRDGIAYGDPVKESFWKGLIK